MSDVIWTIVINIKYIGDNYFTILPQSSIKIPDYGSNRFDLLLKIDDKNW